jgi:hypothetical protein
MVVASWGRSVQDIYALLFDTRLHKVSPAGSRLLPLDYCPVMWSSAAKKDLVKLQLAQNRAACFALCNQRANINHMQASLSCLRVEERLTALLFVFLNKKHECVGNS